MTTAHIGGVGSQVTIGSLTLVRIAIQDVVIGDIMRGAEVVSIDITDEATNTGFHKVWVVKTINGLMEIGARGHSVQVRR